MIIDHTHRLYREKREGAGWNRFNGAYYYSREIVKNIIPDVKTDRNWITVNIMGMGCDHAVVFIHNNLHPGRYDWLRKHKDLILVCGIEETCEKVAHLGTPIYLPLSIDVGYVEQFRVPDEEREGMAFAGRRSKMGRWEGEKPEGLSIIAGMNRIRMLQEMAKREVVYAVGRTAIEARCLGCEIRAYDPRYPDPGIWKVIDNKDAARILQRKLDKIDKKRGEE